MPENKNQDQQPKITFQLGRIEELSIDERTKVEGLNDEITQGFVIKEYKSGSFVKLRKFVPSDNLFTSQINKELTATDRKKITEFISEKIKA